MEERDLNCSEEKSFCLTMGDFATKVTKILIEIGFLVVKEMHIVDCQIFSFLIIEECKVCSDDSSKIT